MRYHELDQTQLYCPFDGRAAIIDVEFTKDALVEPQFTVYNSIFE